MPFFPIHFDVICNNCKHAKGIYIELYIYCLYIVDYCWEKSSTQNWDIMKYMSFSWYFEEIDHQHEMENWAISFCVLLYFEINSFM